MKGDITIRDLNRTFDMDLPDEEASTIAGLVMYESGLYHHQVKSLDFIT